MNWTAVLEIFKKDIQETTRNRYVFLSVSVLPIIIIVENLFAVIQLIGQPSGVSELNQILPVTSLIVLLIPSVVTALLASTSVVIEKNNRSLEPLLASPITDAELLLGKCLAAFVPAMVVSYGTLAVLIGAIDALTIGALGYALLPTPSMAYQVALIPLVGLLGTFISLLVSTKIKDVRAAQQVSTFAVLPILAFAAFISGIYAVDPLYQIMAIIILAVAVVFMARVTIRRFSRESILISWS
ncbi:MAG: ABC transporter permease subunit [Candidatus Bathyarchaeia archaeon]|jgi:ABC-2 type transport system permease protein